VALGDGPSFLFGGGHAEALLVLETTAGGAVIYNDARLAGF
jgi:hypothetical protein